MNVVNCSMVRSIAMCVTKVSVSQNRLRLSYNVMSSIEYGVIDLCQLTHDGLTCVAEYNYDN